MAYVHQDLTNSKSFEDLLEDFSDRAVSRRS
jgi:hypothetical protein